MCLVNILVNFSFTISTVGGYITGSISWVVHVAMLVVVWCTHSIAMAGLKNGCDQ